MVAVAEGMNLGIKLGMDPVKLAGIFNTSTARCWSSDSYNPVPNILPAVPSSREYSGGFGTSLMLKDLGLAVEAANNKNIHLHLGELVNRLYKQIVTEGNGNKDFSFIYQFLNNLNKQKAESLSIPNYKEK
jgi:3-hydroxyisobutyrate dehydrogenase